MSDQTVPRANFITPPGSPTKPSPAPTPSKEPSKRVEPAKSDNDRAIRSYGAARTIHPIKNPISFDHFQVAKGAGGNGSGHCLVKSITDDVVAGELRGIVIVFHEDNEGQSQGYYPKVRVAWAGVSYVVDLEDIPEPDER